MRAVFTAAGDVLVSVVFPAGCRICNALLVDSRRVPICKECLASFERAPAPACEICGRPLAALAQKAQPSPLCPACQEKTYAFDYARTFAT